MINTGKTSVLERNETVNEQSATYENSYNNRASGTLSGDYSVSNDLMRNYAEKGLLFEENLREENEVADSYGYSDEDIDVTPSATTMQFTLENDDYEEDQLQTTNKSYKISPRGKIMIAVYTLVVATIIALIAMNAKVLKSMEESINEKETAIGSLAAQTEILSEELAYVSSEEVISQKAIELGMTK